MKPIRDHITLDPYQLQIVLAALGRNAELIQAIHQAWQTPTASRTYLLDASLDMKALATTARVSTVGALVVLLDSLHAAIPEEMRQDVDAKVRATVARLQP